MRAFKFICRLVVVVLVISVVFFVSDTPGNEEDNDEVIGKSDDVKVHVRHKYDDDSDDEPEEDVINKRRQDWVIQVILVGYMRGGSSLVGEAFNHHPAALYWYEPLAQFYSAVYGTAITAPPKAIVYHDGRARNGLRTLPSWEKEAMQKYFETMFSCRLSQFPPEVLGSLRFMRHATPAQPFYECLLKNSQINPGKMATIKAEDIRDFSYQDFRWDLTCKNSTNMTSYCTRTNLECRKVLTALNNREALNFSDESLATYLTDNTLFSRDKVQVVARDFLLHRACQDKVQATISQCLSETNLEKTCAEKRLIVAKCLRVKIANMESIIAKNPNLRVLHYVRDPRAIAYSQVYKKRDLTGQDAEYVNEVQNICTEMAHDLQARLSLELKYPGVFHQVRYEDLVLNNVHTVSDMYRHLGYDSVPPEVTQWMEIAMNATEETGVFGTQRTNATQIVDTWRRELDATVVAEVTQATPCKELLSALNYT